MAYLSVLDGVRSVAVLLVVVCHLLLHLTGNVVPASYSFRTIGHLGVAIFFVHTTLVLLGSLERHGAEPVPFYVRRIFRIYPLSITIVLLLVLFRLAADAPIEAERLWGNLLLVQNLMGELPYLGPLWSLPYEVQMYLGLPVLYAIVTRTRRPLLWFTLIYAVGLALAAADAANLPRFHVPGITASFFRYTPCFMAGVLAYVLVGRIPQVLPPVCLALFLACCIALEPWLVSTGLQETPLMWGICLVLGCAIPACRGLKCKPIATVTKTVATYSYGVYLTHEFALGAIDGLMPGPVIVQWGAMLILLAGLPYICYHGIEKRGIALGERLAARYARRSQRGQQRSTTGG